MLGERGPSVADGGFVAVAVLVAVGWPVPPTGRVGLDLRRIRAMVAQVALAAPIWAAATGADAVVDTVARVALVASIGAAWALAAATWPSGGAWMAAGSILLACMPEIHRPDALFAWASAPVAFAAGVATTLAHLAAVVSVLAVGMCRSRVRDRLTSS